MYLGRSICRDAGVRSLSVPGAAFDINLTGHKSHANPRNAITAARIAVIVVATAAVTENAKLVEYASERERALRRYRRVVGVTRDYPFAFIAFIGSIDPKYSLQREKPGAIRRSRAV